MEFQAKISKFEMFWTEAGYKVEEGKSVVDVAEAVRGSLEIVSPSAINRKKGEGEA